MKKGTTKLARSWFTLVELIVVITILAILWTIAFIALQWYSSNARDSVRVTDMSRIKSSLELFKIESAVYPEPTNGVEITYQTFEVFTQWTFGQSTFRNVEKLDKIPLDPADDNPYIYTVTNSRKEYQIWWYLESDNDIALNLSIDEAEAARKRTRAKINWSYNGRVITVKRWPITSILAVPTIIVSTERTLLQEIVDNKELVYDGQVWTGATLVQPTKLEIFSWDITILSEQDSTWVGERQTLVKNLQAAYRGTDIENEEQIATLVSLDTTNYAEMEELATTIITTNITEAPTISLASASSSNCDWSVHWDTKDFWSVSYVEATAWQEACDSAKKTFTCDNGVYLDGEVEADTTTYQYKSCTVWLPVNCDSITWYSHNGKMYNTPIIEHWASQTVTSEAVNENNGSYTYVLTMDCNDGTLENHFEWDSTLVSCDTSYHTIDNTTCESDTKIVACSQTWWPENATYTVENETITWDSITSSWSTVSECAWTCSTWYHLENELCLADTKSCTVTNWTWEDTWSTGTNNRGWCTVTSCNTDYHIENNACVADTWECTIDNWVWEMVYFMWVWWSCELVSCNNWFHTENVETCTSDSKTVECTQSGAPLNSTYNVVNETINYVNGAWETPSICTWTCSTWFHDEGDGQCISDSDTMACVEAWAPLNSTYISAMVDITWTGTSRSTPANCDWTCNDNYTNNNGSCDADTKQEPCAWTIPANATASTATSFTQTWNGTAWDPSTWTWWENHTYCDFDCNLNYTWNSTAGTCDANWNVETCWWTQPDNTTLNEWTTYSQTWNGSAWTPVLNYSYATSWACTYSCSTNYVRNDLNGTCDAWTQSVTCGWTQPDNTILNSWNTYTQTWDGSAWSPTTSYTYATTWDCSYQCSTDFHTEDLGLTCISDTRSCTVTNWTWEETWNGTTWSPCAITSCNTWFHIESWECMSDTKQVQCTDVTPTNATSTPTEVTVTWNGTTYSTPDDCSWTCNDNYDLNITSDGCSPAIVSTLCSGTQPDFSVLNSWNSYTQTWDGTVYAPTLSFHYATSWDCSFLCQSWYHEDNGLCVEDINYCTAWGTIPCVAQ